MWTPSDLAGRLADESRRLAGLQLGNLAVRSSCDLVRGAEALLGDAVAPELTSVRERLAAILDA